MFNIAKHFTLQPRAVPCVYIHNIMLELLFSGIVFLCSCDVAYIENSGHWVVDRFCLNSGLDSIDGNDDAPT